jgi:hypothetical protein
VTSAENEKELELERRELTKRFGLTARLYRDVKLTLPGGVLIKRTLSGDLITCSSGLVLIPRSVTKGAGPIAHYLTALGPVGYVLLMIISWMTDREASSRQGAAESAGGAAEAKIAEVCIPYESIQRLETIFGTLYVTVPAGTYSLSGNIPSIAELRDQVAARVGVGRLGQRPHMPVKRV